jgi:hypothetical protein
MVRVRYTGDKAVKTVFIPSRGCIALSKNQTIEIPDEFIDNIRVIRDLDIIKEEANVKNKDDKVPGGTSKDEGKDSSTRKRAKKATRDTSRRRADEGAPEGDKGAD